MLLFSLILVLRIIALYFIPLFTEFVDIKGPRTELHLSYSSPAPVRFSHIGEDQLTMARAEAPWWWPRHAPGSMSEDSSPGSPYLPGTETKTESQHCEWYLVVGIPLNWCFYCPRMRKNIHWLAILGVLLVGQSWEEQESRGLRPFLVSSTTIPGRT